MILVGYGDQIRIECGIVLRRMLASKVLNGQWVDQRAMRCVGLVSEPSRTREEAGELNVADDLLEQALRFEWDYRSGRYQKPKSIPCTIDPALKTK